MRSTVWVGVAAGVAGAVLASGVISIGGSAPHVPTPAYAADSAAQPDGVTVVGTGLVTGASDTLTLSMGVNVTRGSVSDALDAANRRMAKVMSALKAHGVATKDLQTTGLNVYPQYTNDGRRITGYQVSESLSAKLRHFGTAGAAITAGIDAGGDEARVDGLSASLEDNSSLLVDARDRAFADARSKAEQYARLAGRPLASVRTISEQVVNTTPQPYYAGDKLAFGSAPAASPVPVSAGEQAVSVTVTVVWTLG